MPQALDYGPDHHVQTWAESSASNDCSFDFAGVESYFRFGAGVVEFQAGRKLSDLPVVFLL
jgi:hypothetical protein